jgi:uncharacterized protein (DUF2237 family)
MVSKRNVLGTELRMCCSDPLTGYHRDGFCAMSAADPGAHVVCAEVTKDFLEYTASQGNDLSTPNPEYGFPGLKPGDRWCLCAARWKEALDAGKAPHVVLEATHEYALEYVELHELKSKQIKEHQ